MVKQKKGKSKVSKVFGVPFEKTRESSIPPFIFLFLSFLRQHPRQGIFRVPGSKAIIERLKHELDSGEECIYVYAPEYTHEIASVVKMWFRELPEPLLTYENYDMFIAAVGIKESTARLEMIKKVINFLPEANRKLLYSLCEFLHDMLEYEEVTKMNSNNLAIVFAPNLLRPRVEDIGTMMSETPHATALMQTLLVEFEYIFNDYVTEEQKEREELKERARKQLESTNKSKPRWKPLPKIPIKRELDTPSPVGPDHSQWDVSPGTPNSPSREVLSPKPPPPQKSSSLLALRRGNSNLSKVIGEWNESSMESQTEKLDSATVLSDSELKNYLFGEDPSLVSSSTVPTPPQKNESLKRLNNVISNLKNNDKSEISSSHPDSSFISSQNTAQISVASKHAPPPPIRSRTESSHPLSPRIIQNDGAPPPIPPKKVLNVNNVLEFKSKEDGPPPLPDRKLRPMISNPRKSP